MERPHQYLDQLEPEIRHAAGTLVSFRVGARDAAHITREFKPVFSATDLMNLPNHHIFLKLMIDGEPAKPFSAVTLPRHPCPGHRSRKASGRRKRR